MFLFLFHYSCSPSGHQTQRQSVVFFGDSILRNLEKNLLTFDIPYRATVYCYPGATIASLRESIRKEFGNTFEHSTSHVVIHIGTNNLSRLLWERERKHLIYLYSTLTEIFRSASIVFSCILPRWDSDELHSFSTIFNAGLVELCSSLPNCAYLDSTDDFLDSVLFCADGIHLNGPGKSLLSSIFHYFLLNRFNCLPSSKESSHARVFWTPPELKKLYTPQKKKKKNDQCQWKETNLNLIQYLRRERRSTYFNFDRPSRKKKRCKRPEEGEEGFLHPRYTAKRSPTPPELPPHQYIPEKIRTYIPYRALTYNNVFKLSSCHLPSPLKPYVRWKLSKKRARSGRKTQSKKRRRKVCLRSINNSIIKGYYKHMLAIDCH